MLVSLMTSRCCKCISLIVEWVVTCWRRGDVSRFQHHAINANVTPDRLTKIVVTISEECLECKRKIVLSLDERMNELNKITKVK